MERLNDPLTATPSESRVSATPIPLCAAYSLGNSIVFCLCCFQLVVRLGRALKPGEHRIKLYLLKINQTEVKAITHAFKHSL